MSKETDSTFEQRLQRLEEIADQLRNDDVPIDDATRLFEEGLSLSKELQSELSALEQRIEILTNPPESPDPVPERPGSDQNESNTPAPDAPEFTLFDER